MSTPKPRTDVLIIGSGAAGLSLALRLPETLDVTVLSKGDLATGATGWAQGGMAAVLADPSARARHVEDTLQAGAGLPDRGVVSQIVDSAAEQVRWLESLAMPFSRMEDGALHLTREGGHSERRVVHAADRTGKALADTLIKAVRQRPNITVLERHLAIDLVTTRRLGAEENRCLGAYVLDREADRVLALHARYVVLATGGAAKVYLYTSNPDSSTGDGIAMGWRAGCRVANMEFIQFHPTCLYEPRAKSFLISEAVRGEGGRLIHADGQRFMHNYDPRGELAPRDIVARAIDSEMKRWGLDCVYLDISHKSPEFIREHFPTIHQRCLDFGYDMTREPLPVVPAAHYTCGGVMVDRRGRTDVDGLYAIGETSHTGLHGANRLASNSLLECLVYGHAAATDITRRVAEEPVTAADAVIPPWDESLVSDPDEAVIVSHNWDELRRAMWDYVGIVRTTKRLQRAHHRITLLRREIHDYYANFRISNNLIELRNLVEVADLIVRSALRRKESRGLHFTRDYPEPRAELAHRNTILRPDLPRPYARPMRDRKQS
ncbi:MAG: L-aspartate oxidase [Halothiobacillaceae bacterium]